MNGSHENRRKTASLELDHVSASSYEAAPGDAYDVDIEGQTPALFVQPDSQPPPNHHLAFLDGLRGLAALMLYSSDHITWYYVGIRPDDDLGVGFGFKGHRYFATLPFISIFFSGGNQAATVFILLSAFVLSRAPLRKVRDGEKPFISLLSATIRRPLRLFVAPIGVSLAVAICLQLPIRPLADFPPVSGNIFKQLGDWFIEVLCVLNPFVYHGPVTRWFTYDPPVWAVAAQLHASIFVFALIAAASFTSRRNRPIILALSSVVLLWIGHAATACFIAGILLAVNDVEQWDEIYLKRLSSRTKSIILHTVFVAGWYLLSQVSGTVGSTHRSYDTFGWYWLTMAVPDAYFDREYWRFWHSIGAFMVLYAILKIRWLQVRLASLRYLGKISFSLYLTHIPFLWIIGDRCYRLFGYYRDDTVYDSVFDEKLAIPDVGPKGLTTGYLAAQAVVFPLNLLLSHYTTKWLEEPGIQAGQWLSAKLLGPNRQ